MKSVVTIAGPEQLTDRTWRRFLAGLCLLHFYADSVRCGTELLRAAIWPKEYEQHMLWVHTLWVLRALVLLALGRVLWWGRGSIVGWGVAALVSTVALVICWLYFNSRELGTAALPLLMNAWLLGEFLPFLAALAAGAWCWIRERHRHAAARGWVVVAAAWCFAQVPLIFLPQNLLEPYSAGLAVLSKSNGLFVGVASYTLALCCTGAALLLKKKVARPLSFALACVGAIPILADAYLFPKAVNAANEALMISNPANPSNPLPWPWILLNTWSFRYVLAFVPALCVPWLLIAWYARHVPMRGMPDDGTPYPRLYCSQCGYNLRGLTGGNCPECGVAVDLPLVATSTPSAAS